MLADAQSDLIKKEEIEEKIKKVFDKQKGKISNLGSHDITQQNKEEVPFWTIHNFNRQIMRN